MQSACLQLHRSTERGIADLAFVEYPPVILTFK